MVNHRSDEEKKDGEKSHARMTIMDGFAMLTV